MGEPDNLKGLMRVAIDFGFASPVSLVRNEDIEERRPDIAGRGHLDVLDHAQILKDSDVLKCSRQTKPCNSVRFKSKDFLSTDPDGSNVGVRGTAQRVKKSGLARSVRTDNRLYDAPRDIQIDVVERDEATEPARHAPCGKD
jgi:hypothetical protein